MFADIVKLISLSKSAPYIIFGGTIIVDEPICKKEQADESYAFTTDCIDNWVIKDIAEVNSKNKIESEHKNNELYITTE
jgi:hypothetical protein